MIARRIVEPAVVRDPNLLDDPLCESCRPESSQIEPETWRRLMVRALYWRASDLRAQSKAALRLVPVKDDFRINLPSFHPVSLHEPEV